MSTILALGGLAIVVWAIWTMFLPPKKHKDFSLHDRDKAAARALGGSGPPDLSNLEPRETGRKGRKKQ